MRITHVWLLTFFMGGLTPYLPVKGEEIRDSLVVTASRIPLPLSAVGSSVSVIDRAEIEAREALFAVDLLQNVPGFAVSRAGSLGSQTQVRLRGAEANQVLVLLDGIEANDPAGNDEFGFQNLTTWDIERIEVVRGPQSALWGSDAVAGVINIISRPGTRAFVADGFAEFGSFDSTAFGGRVAGEVGGTRAGLSLSRVDSNGTNISRSGTEQDGYENTTGTLTLAGSPTETLDLDFIGRYTNTRKAFDGTDFFVTGLPTDTADVANSALGYFRVGGTLALADGRWTQGLRAALTTTDTENSNEFGDNGTTRAEKYGLYYQTSWQFKAASTASTGTSLTLALEQEREEFKQTGADFGFGNPNQQQSVTNKAAVLEWLFSPLPRLSLSLSGRYDQSSAFNNIGTFRATTAWTTPVSATRLHGSIGTGQKSPTFIERFGFFPDQFIGNPNLEPETSTGWELGFDQPLFNGLVSLAATYFREELENEINGFAFDSETFLFTAENLDGRSQRRGVEVSATANVSASLKFYGSYTYVNSSQPDPLTGVATTEIRRPRQVASLNGDWSFMGNRGNLNLNLSYVGQQNDTFFEVAPPFSTQNISLDAYTLVSLATSYRLAEQTKIYLRLDNLLNASYEDVYGYNTPGTSLYAGLRWSF